MRNTIKVESLALTGRPAENLVDMLIKVEHLPEVVPFTANFSDVREYGRHLYAMAISGEWNETKAVKFTPKALEAIIGQVAPAYIPKTPIEIAVQENPLTRHKAMVQAVTQAQHFDMMGDPSQATAWRIYYQQLHTLEQASGWPLVEQWPSAPDLVGEFGPVTEYVPPTPAEIAARDNPPLRRKQMKLAAEQATHWDMMGDATRAAAWRGYYRELYAMSESPEWPMVEPWPVHPDGPEELVFIAHSAK